ncbi:MAG: hypothetical protein HDS69_07480 [Bacteroidales bacterium]|nr:hypothetical protein [Bacteroidales bacterium]
MAKFLILTTFRHFIKRTKIKETITVFVQLSAIAGTHLPEERRLLREHKKSLRRYTLSASSLPMSNIRPLSRTVGFPAENCQTTDDVHCSMPKLQPLPHPKIWRFFVSSEACQRYWCGHISFIKPLTEYPYVSADSQPYFLTELKESLKAYEIRKEHGDIPDEILVKKKQCETAHKELQEDMKFSLAQISPIVQ